MKKIMGHNRTEEERPNIKKLALGMEEMERLRKYIDGIQVQDGPYMEQQRKAAEDLGIPVYAASDSHRISDIFSSSTEFSDLNFWNLRKLKDGIRERLKTDATRFYGSRNWKEDLRHKASVAIAVLGLKSGLLQQTKQ